MYFSKDLLATLACVTARLVIASCISPCVSIGRGADSLAANVVVDPQSAVATKASDADIEFFESRVRPLLSDKCFGCHGDDVKLEGNVRLTDRASLLRGGDSGPAAIAGDVQNSLLVQVVNYSSDIQMPPDGKLSPGEIELLTSWVQRGLPWPGDQSDVPSESSKPKSFAITDEQRSFWSFRDIHAVAPPTVQQSDWPRNNIDRFVLSAMEQNQLSPATAADKRMLLRRATFDLVGLPPTIEELDAFLADDSPDAFGRVIDRLLDSPKYGERWGRHWLDVVRYADSRDMRSFGDQTDIFEAWRYRDWVVRALNDDMPYDRFIKYQIAGDLLPALNASEINADGMVATGMLTIGEWGFGDADKEKMVTDIVDDQIDVVSKAVLGLTISCARCHDHKFDPISHRDYYALAGIFFSTHIIPEVGAKGAGTPILKTPLISAAEIEGRKRDHERATELERIRNEELESSFKRVAEQMLSGTADYLMATAAVSDISASTGSGTQRERMQEVAANDQLDPVVLQRWVDLLWSPGRQPFDLPTVDVYSIPGLLSWRCDADLPSAMVNTTDSLVNHLSYSVPAKSVVVHPSATVGTGVTWKNSGAQTIQIRGRVSDTDPNCGNGVAWRLELVSDRRVRIIASGSVGSGASQSFSDLVNASDLSAISIKPDDLIRLVIPAAEDYSCDSTLVELSITEVGGSSRNWSLAEDVATNPWLQSHRNPYSDRYGQADIWTLHEVRSEQLSSAYSTESSLAAFFNLLHESAGGSVPREKVAQAAELVQQSVTTSVASGVDVALQEVLKGHSSPFWMRQDDLRYVGNESKAKIEAIAVELKEIRERLKKPIPVAIAAQDGGVPGTAYQGIQDARLHLRGSYTRLGEVVPRGFPEILVGTSKPTTLQGSGRRELAEWLASTQQPLTARVIVNRIWQYHFGNGIVRTPNNFGKLGQPPSHPELLDYLAAQFVNNGWSIKSLHRAIMLSATYQQSSHPSPEAIERDPENVFLSHANRHRLEAEAIRDSLLACSGKLDPQVGGPSIRDFATPRRTLYTMTVRSDKSDFRTLFDAADPETPTDVRTQSTVAPQALFLMNHPFVVEQAKYLAQLVLNQSGLDGSINNDQDRVTTLYQRLYLRNPNPDELAIAIKMLHPVTTGFVEGIPTVATPEQKASQLAAWHAYCQVLLCANEFFYVD